MAFVTTRHDHNPLIVQDTYSKTLWLFRFNYGPFNSGTNSKTKGELMNGARFRFAFWARSGIAHPLIHHVRRYL